MSGAARGAALPCLLCCAALRCATWGLLRAALGKGILPSLRLELCTSLLPRQPLGAHRPLPCLPAPPASSGAGPPLRRLWRRAWL